MSCVMRVEINGHEWAVTSGGVFEQEINVPATQSLDALSDNEIGAMVRRLVRTAQRLSAEEYCDWLAMNLDGQSPSRIPEGIRQEAIRKLAPFIHEDSEISMWYHLIVNEEVQRVKREEKQAVRIRKGAGYVYVIQHDGLHKIGRTKNPDRRIEKELQPRLPREVTVVHIIKAENMFELESALHDRFADKRLNGEWFELDEGDIAWLRTL